jgi:hypothetical protein
MVHCKNSKIVHCKNCNIVKIYKKCLRYQDLCAQKCDVVFV